jgi:hypothetical protein
MLAILIGVVAVVVASQLIRSDDSTESGGGVDPATVSIAVLNATSSPGMGSDVADILEAKGFVVASNTSTTQQNQSAVFFAKGAKAKGRAVARTLKLPQGAKFQAEQEAAADGADVVVVAGEDGRAASKGKSGGDSEGDPAADAEVAPDGEG